MSLKLAWSTKASSSTARAFTQRNPVTKNQREKKLPPKPSFLCSVKAPQSKLECDHLSPSVTGNLAMASHVPVQVPDIPHMCFPQQRREERSGSCQGLHCLSVFFKFTFNFVSCESSVSGEAAGTPEESQRCEPPVQLLGTRPRSSARAGRASVPSFGSRHLFCFCFSDWGFCIPG